MAPLEPVVADQTAHEIQAEIGVETRIVLVGIAAVDARVGLNRQGGVRSTCAADHPDRRQRDANQKKCFHSFAPSCCYRRLQALSRFVHPENYLSLGGRKNRYASPRGFINIR